jgi:hypothetical protein
LAKVERSHTRREKRGWGPNCLLFSEAGRWYLYDTEISAKEQVRYDSSESKGKEKMEKYKFVSPATGPHGDEGEVSK